jgi:hypothetical protein
MKNCGVFVELVWNGDGEKAQADSVVSYVLDCLSVRCHRETVRRYDHGNRNHLDSSR